MNQKGNNQATNPSVSQPMWINDVAMISRIYYVTRIMNSA